MAASLAAAGPSPLLYGSGRSGPLRLGPGSHPAQEEESLHLTLLQPTQDWSTAGSGAGREATWGMPEPKAGRLGPEPWSLDGRMTLGVRDEAFAHLTVQEFWGL